ncbi:hypothetical protein RESH_05579 [Rhodopirellula europaea SH398]|uniref:Uncharacterized protein n=1 Tax=Rhodopirellula europaea SH398 TaxID=1263868 RepID=M5S873_9BACT|nr:hypothetical protein RESH_05579 [Rhodopirellula europaea SH398]
MEKTEIESMQCRIHRLPESQDVCAYHILQCTQQRRLLKQSDTANETQSQSSSS